MRTKIIAFLEEKRLSTGGHCGTTLPQLVSELNGELEEVKEILNNLHARGLIQIRKGIHGRMIFMKKKEYNG